MNRLLLFLALFAMPLIASAEEPIPPRWNITAECDMVILPQASALPLIADLNDEAKIEAAWTRLRQMIDRGEPTLAASLLGRGTSSEQCLSESVEEMKYPVEYNPPQVPKFVPAEKALETLKIGWPILTTTTTNRVVVENIHELSFATEYCAPAVAVVSNGAVIDQTKSLPQPGDPAPDATILAAAPTAFGTRKTGVTLEAEPNIAPDVKHILLNLSAEHVRLKGMIKSTIENPKGGYKVVVEQPEFETQKVFTSLTVRSGQRKLLGIFHVTEPANHLELFLLKATILKVE